MEVFHWGRPVGKYAFFESWKQCLQSWLGSFVVSRLSRRINEISNRFDISTTIADPCNQP